MSYNFYLLKDSRGHLSFIWRQVTSVLFLLIDLMLLLFHPRVDEQFLSASPVTGKITTYLLPLTRVHRRWGKDNRIFLKPCLKQGRRYRPLSSASQEGGTEPWRGSAPPTTTVQGHRAPGHPPHPEHFLTQHCTQTIHVGGTPPRACHCQPLLASSALPGGPHSWDWALHRGPRTGSTAKLWQ